MLARLHSRTLSAFCFSLLALACWGGALAEVSAQIVIQGDVSDSTTGPLLAGQVYHAPTGLVVPEGQALTVEPGVVVKMGIAVTWSVAGTLDVQGTALEPVVLTSIEDDNLGGDTNGNGPSSGAAGDWGLLRFEGTSQSCSLVHTIVQFAGGNLNPAVELDGSGHTLRNLTVRDCERDGLDLLASSEMHLIEGCSFLNNGGQAIVNANMRVVSGIVNTVATGNGVDAISCTQNILFEDITLGPQNGINGTLRATASVRILDGVTCTLEPGLILKMSNFARLEVDGTLESDGLVGNPIHIVSDRDDSLGGDTNGDGPSTGTAGDWLNICFGGSPDSRLVNTVVRNSGFGGQPSVVVLNDGLFVDGLTVEDGGGDGIDLSFSFVDALRNSNFISNQGTAVDSARLDDLAVFSNNMASGNRDGDWIRVSAVSLLDDSFIVADNQINGALAIVGNMSIPAGLSLTVGPGVGFKMFPGSSVQVAGSLEALGTFEEPIVFTTWTDDTLGGDTNSDGNQSQPTPGSWGVVQYGFASQGNVEHVEVRYGGAGFTPSEGGVKVNSDLVNLRNVNANRCLKGGIQLTEFGSAERLTAWSNGEYGVRLSGENPPVAHITSVGNPIGVESLFSYTGAVRNSISWNNTDDYVGFSMTQVTYSNGQSGLPAGIGNLSVDPMFEDQGLGNFQLELTSLCIDSGDPNSPKDSDGTRADMGAFHFDRCSPLVYCSPLVTSQACVPSIAFEGASSATSGLPFELTLLDVPNAVPGLLWYGLAGRANIPFQGGTLCVEPPLVRTDLQNSGGDSPFVSNCSGSLRFDFNAWVQSNLDLGLTEGTLVNAQYVFRDGGSALGYGLSNAIEFGVCP